MKQKTFVFIGPPGSGKTTFVKDFKDGVEIGEIVSHTTRDIRKEDGEEHGETYYYVDKEELNQLNLIEEVDRKGNLYGIAKSEVERKRDQFKINLVITDLGGYYQLQELYGEEIVSIFIYATPTECKERMHERGDKLDKIESKILYAEMNYEFDNFNKCDYVLMNKDDQFNVNKNILFEIIKDESDIRVGNFL